MWQVINHYLKEKNMTIYQISKLSGIRKQGLYALRDGRAKDLSLRNAFKLADALGIDVNEFRKE